MLRFPPPPLPPEIEVGHGGWSGRGFDWSVFAVVGIAILVETVFSLGLIWLMERGDIPEDVLARGWTSEVYVGAP
jgi:hypothetical protein